MRVILVYDIPVIEEENRKIYRIFNKNLKKIGFTMLQYSVYTKVIQNDTSYKQLINRLDKIVPTIGSIIIFKVTEQQFQNMIYLSGSRNKFEAIVGGRELVIFGGDS